MLEESLFLHNICSGFVYKSKEEIKMYLFFFFLTFLHLKQLIFLDNDTKRGLG